MSDTESFAGAAVIAPHPSAAIAARDVLIEGGNAIEAAVAALAVVSVVLPEAAGAGGDGLWLVREAGARGRTRILDARGPASEVATPKAFRDRGHDFIPAHGPLSSFTVPGAVAGWRAALELSTALEGRLPAPRLLEPAVALAREGFSASDPALRPLPTGFADQLALAARFLVDGKRPEAGAMVRAPAWAETLAYLAQAGLDDFYRGDVAREIAREIETVGALLTRDDLRRFEPRWREPLSHRTGFGLAEAPPSRAGLKLLVTLGLVDLLPAGYPESPAHLHGRIEAMKLANGLVETAGHAGRDGESLLSRTALQIESLRIDANRAAPGSIGEEPTEESVWVGIVDGAGLAVSVVQSIGTAFGSGCLLSRTDLLLGNRGTAFELDDGRDRIVRRGRRAPMRAMPIAITGRQGRLTVIGASDWRLAASAATDLAAGSPPATTIGAARLLPGGAIVAAEEAGDPSLVAALIRRGHEVEPFPSGSAGEAGMIDRDSSGRLNPAADRRRGAVLNGF